MFECLEGRELLAFSPLGMSLPDLTVTGFASPAASWGGPLTVTVNVRNLGASTTIEPLATFQGSPSSGDAAASTVSVVAVRNPHSLRNAVTVGQFAVPAVAQNGEIQQTTTITLPNRPTGFPGDGGRVYLLFVANASGTVLESDPTNDVSRPVPVLIEAPLPELAAVGLDVPPVMQPGDTIQPNIRVANFGPADTLAQGPVQVAIVASTSPRFTSGSSIVALYSVPNIPGASQIASQGVVLGDANLSPAANVVTIAGEPVTLPISPRVYYIGVVVDPYNTLKELRKVPQFTRPKNPFSLSHVVGPPIVGLPPAGVLVSGGAANVPAFPIPFGALPVGGSLSGSTFPAPFPPLAPVVVSASTGTPVVGSTTLTDTTAARLSASALRHAARVVSHASPRLTALAARSHARSQA